MSDPTIDDFLKGFGVKPDPAVTDLYRRYPSFDHYPKYMQDALIVNEKMQGRMK